MRSMHKLFVKTTKEINKLEQFMKSKTKWSVFIKNG